MGEIFLQLILREQKPLKLWKFQLACNAREDLHGVLLVCSGIGPGTRTHGIKHLSALDNREP